jgi:hypothetical protein
MDTDKEMIGSIRQRKRMRNHGAKIAHGTELHPKKQIHHKDTKTQRKSKKGR